MRCGAVGLPNGWRWGILGEECEVVGGGTPKRDVVTYFGGTVPWATPTDVTALDSLEMSATKETVTAEGLANSSAKLLPKGAVLLTSRATIGFTAVAATQMCTNQGFANFVCKEALLPEYLAYWLPTQKDEMMRLAGGTTFKEISRGALKKFRVPVAPLTEQRRIVDILKRADGIRRLRKQAIQTARELIPALFVDMFGEQELPVLPLGSVAEVVSGVTKGRRFNGKKTVVVPYLRVANVQAGHLDLSEIKTVEVLPSDVEKLALQKGDVLLTEGGDYDKLGRGALWDHEIENCIHQNHIFRVRADRSRMDPVYFANFLQTQAARLYFLKSAKRTTNLASINMTQLRNLPVPIPLLSDQAEFVVRANDVKSIERQQEAAELREGHLFESVLHRAFRGEL